MIVEAHIVGCFDVFYVKGLRGVGHIRVEFRTIDVESIPSHTHGVLIHHYALFGRVPAGTQMPRRILFQLGRSGGEPEAKKNERDRDDYLTQQAAPVSLVDDEAFRAICSA